MSKCCTEVLKLCSELFSNHSCFAGSGLFSYNLFVIEASPRTNPGDHLAAACPQRSWVTLVWPFYIVFHHSPRKLSWLHSAPIYRAAPALSAQLPVLWKGMTFLHTNVFYITFLQKRGIITHAKIWQKRVFEFFAKCYKYHFPPFFRSHGWILFICIKLGGVVESKSPNR